MLAYKDLYPTAVLQPADVFFAKASLPHPVLTVPVELEHKAL